MGDIADAAVDAIGRCALLVGGAVAESCLTGLVSLIASPQQDVISAAVQVLKRLLHENAPVALLTRVVALLDGVQAPAARACVVWLIATHVEQVRHPHTVIPLD
jgi:hypothetical protein